MQLLPMLGLTHGNRDAVTCHLKCDSACAQPVPNQSTEPTFREVAETALSRRSVLLAGSGLAAAAAVPLSLDTSLAAAATGGPVPAVGGRLPFTPITSPSAATDAVTVPPGYQWHPVIRWGDPLFADSSPFRPGVPDAEAQAGQFGYNNDYLDILVAEDGRRGVLVANHEYVNPGIMYAPSDDPAVADERKRATMAAHGFTVVEVERREAREAWRYVQGAPLNRRLTVSSEFELTGPVAGSEYVRTVDDPEGVTVLGTLNNCAGGTTPWGTILSGEENFNGYFRVDPEARGSARYGINERPTPNRWEEIEDRFDARNEGYANEPHRFGWIVEIDPYDVDSTPRKHTAMGRFKHEGATIRVDEDGTVAAYMGDDERFDYLYKFVSSRTYMAGDSAQARANNRELLVEGNLYVARFSGRQQPDNGNLGRGVWIPLIENGRSRVPQMDVEEVLVFTREAADKMRATPMDRPEDVEPSPTTGKVYMACTNNTRRGTGNNPDADAANPRNQNKEGHVIEITERSNRVASRNFDWNLLLVCGLPDQAGTYFGGWDGPVAPISCPDNLAFDSEGTLWVSTDGQPGTINKCDALHRVELDGDERGRVSQFLAVPAGAETCGPVIHDADGSVFVAVQHPGDGGSWASPRSFFPDYVPAGGSPRRGEWRGPRPSVIQVRHVG